MSRLRQPNMSKLLHGNGYHGVPPDGLTLHEAAAPHLEMMEMLLLVADHTALAIGRDLPQCDPLDELLNSACWARFHRDPAWELIAEHVTPGQYPDGTEVDLRELFCKLFPKITRDESREVARSLVYGSQTGV